MKEARGERFISPLRNEGLHHMNYIKMGKALTKMADARKNGHAVYIYGAIGMGKTSAINACLGNEQTLHISCMNGRAAFPDPGRIEENVVLIDGLSLLADEDDQQNLVKFVQSLPEEKFLIMEALGPVPNYLAYTSLVKNYCIISDDDLTLSKDQIVELFAQKDISLSEDEIDEIQDHCFGNTMQILILQQNMMPGQYSDQLWRRVEDGFNHYTRQKWFYELTSDIQSELVSVGWCEDFNVTLGEVLSGDRNFKHLLARLTDAGNFVAEKRPGVYTFLPVYREYLTWELNNGYSKELQRSLYERAISLYEIDGDYKRALSCYKKADNYDGMQKLLQRVCYETPGMEGYQVIDPYFDYLSIDQISNSAVLMSAMSIINSLKIRVKESEFWYDRLKAYEQRQIPGSAKQREAQSRLLFLDLALPHRNHTADIFSELNEDYDILKQSHIQNHVSITDSSASIINGALDYSGVIKNLAETKPSFDNDVFERAINSFIGTSSRSFFQLALLEYTFERGAADEYVFNTHANELYIYFDMEGNIELSTVSCTLLIKSLLAHGASDEAWQTFLGYQRKIDKSGGIAQKRCMNDLKFQMNLLRGDTEEAKSYLETAPNSNISFSFLDRYEYVNKLRALIAVERYREAHSLSSRLKPVFREYNRPYLLAQTLILEAVILNKMNREEWKKSLADGLAIAQQYDYVSLVSQEGISVLPLLEEYDWKDVKDKDYKERVLTWTGKVAKYYPQYLQAKVADDVLLTDRETDVLRLLCEGLTSSQICEGLHISYSGLKFHKTNIYRKLDVSTRREAEMKAKSLGLNLT